MATTIHLVRTVGVVSVALASAALVTATTVAAAIACKNGFQLVQGNYLSTPYCQDDLLAKVARQYGMKVSSAAIRENPNLKRDVCRFVGRDIRVQENCLTANPNGRGRSY